MSLAASLSEIEVQYIDADPRTEDIILPPGGNEIGLSNKTINNWRTHLNAVRM